MIQEAKRLLRLIAATGLLIGLPSATRAADGEEDKWQLITAPFLWAAGIDGNVTLRGITSDISIGFDQIKDHLEGAFMTYVELRKEKFGFYANPMYLKLTGSASTAFPFNTRQTDFEQQLWVVEVGGFYNLVKTGPEDKPLVVDAIAGGRYWNNEFNLSYSGPHVPTVSRGESKNLIDPFIGLRADQRLSKKFHLTVRGDIGGFGASNSSSDFSWQAMGLAGYDFSKRFTLFAGYRALALKKEDGSGTDRHGIDITLNGPILGLQVRW